MVRKHWKKADLIKAIESAPDDASIFLLSREYRHNNDATWTADTQSEFHKVEVLDNEVFITVDCNEFN